MYGIDYTNNGIPALFLHAELYRFAVYFDIPALQTASCAKYRAAAGPRLSGMPSQFPASVQYIYESTPPDDRALRDIAVKCAANHIGVMDKEETFKHVMREAVDFGLDVAMELGKRVAATQPVVRYRCLWCGGLWSTADNISRLDIRYCPLCGHAYFDWSAQIQPS